MLSFIVGFILGGWGGIMLMCLFQINRRDNDEEE
jgi:hypothetical protein